MNAKSILKPILHCSICDALMFRILCIYTNPHTRALTLTYTDNGQNKNKQNVQTVLDVVCEIVCDKNNDGDNRTLISHFHLCALVCARPCACVYDGQTKFGPVSSLAD